VKRACLLLACWLVCQASWSAAAEYDLVIDNVRIIDGSGNPWYRNDIAIAGDRIAGIGDYSTAMAITRIDGTELYAAPGFIDTHSHTADALLDRQRSDVPGLLSQGITAVLINPDGGGSTDIASQIATLREHGTGVNVGLFLPHGEIRKQVMAMADRGPTDSELNRMRDLVRQGMLAGAFGLSSGTFYAPGSFAANDELIAIMKEVAIYGGAYNSHIRDESNYSIGVVAAVEEVIDVGRRTGAPVVVTHIKALGPPVWGMAEVLTRNIEQARREGVQVYTDQYPYIASHTSLDAALLPRWAFDGGWPATVARFSDLNQRPELEAAMAENLARRGGADRIQFSRAPETPAIVGQTLQAWADQKETGAITAAINLLLQGRPGIISFNMSDADLETFMRAPWNMTASDGRNPPWLEGSPHPRGFGTFPRKIRKYVLEQQIITLPDAVRSMTSLPAQVYQIHQRGLLKQGYYADITLFDLDEIKDNATFESPWQYASGIQHVIINGGVAWSNGQLTQVRHGRVLQHE
jgi:N-acyl-D-amino-acid deacylase